VRGALDRAGGRGRERERSDYEDDKEDLAQGVAHGGEHAFAGFGSDGLLSFFVGMLDQFLRQLFEEPGGMAGDGLAVLLPARTMADS
jgi:hypothetical protein